MKKIRKKYCKWRWRWLFRTSAAKAFKNLPSNSFVQVISGGILRLVKSLLKTTKQGLWERFPFHLGPRVETKHKLSKWFVVFVYNQVYLKSFIFLAYITLIQYTLFNSLFSEIPTIYTNIDCKKLFLFIWVLLVFLAIVSSISLRSMALT